MTMTENENAALELVGELQTHDQQIVDTRTKLSKERERLAELESDDTTSPAKLAAAIKKSKDTIEVHEQTIVIVEQRKLPLLERVKPLIKKVQGEHKRRESDAQKKNLEQALEHFQSDQVQAAIKVVACANWYYQSVRGFYPMAFEDLFVDKEGIQELYDKLPAFAQVSEPDAMSQLRAWSHQADTAERDAQGADQNTGLRFG